MCHCWSGLFDCHIPFSHTFYDSTPSNTFGLNWDTDCESDLSASTSVTYCELTDALLAEWDPNSGPSARFNM